MRTFAEIERELNLVKQGAQPRGTLYVVPVRPGAPRIVVRRFDRDLPPSIIPAYTRLLSAAEIWLEHDRTLANAVRFEPPSEIGSDFIARHEVIGTSLSSFIGADEPVDPPDELGIMQARFIARTHDLTEPRASLVAAVLHRSIFDRIADTVYNESEQMFVILDIHPTREELDQWATLTS